MYEVVRFAALGPERRRALYDFIQQLGGSRWFSTYDEMTGNYAGDTFAGGANHLTVWDADRPVGALGVITVTAAENGDAMLVSPYLAAAALDALRALLGEAAAIALAAGARRAVLQLDERSAWARACAEQEGYVVSHESLTLRYAGGERPPLPAGFTVEPLREEDAAAYARIDHDAFIDSPNGVPITVPALLEQMHEPGTRFFLGRWQGEPAAAICLRLRQDGGWIQSLAVAPALQGRGLGRASLRFAVNHLRASCATIRLGVMSNNARALGLYLSEGFERERAVAIWLCKQFAQ